MENKIFTNCLSCASACLKTIIPAGRKPRESGILSQVKFFLKTLFNTQFSKSLGHVVMCWHLLYLWLHKADVLLASCSRFYSCDSPWSCLTLFFQYIESEMLYGKIIGSIFLLPTGNRWGSGSEVPHAPAHEFGPSLAHWCARNAFFYSLLVMWLFQGDAGQGWAFVMVVTVQTSLPPDLLKTFNQWTSWC